MNMIVLFAVVFVLAFTSVSAEHTYRAYGSADGLPERMCYAVDVDGDGVMWIGSRSGLIRFDGRTFTPVGTYSAWNQQLPSILSVYCLNSATVLCGSGPGLFRYDVISRSMTQIKARSTSPVTVRSIVQTNNGDVFIGAENGLFVLRHGDSLINVCVRRTTDNPSILRAIVNLVPLPGGIVEVQHLGHYVSRFDGRTWTEEKKSNVLHRRLRNGSIWAVTDTGAYDVQDPAHRRLVAPDVIDVVSSNEDVVFVITSSSVQMITQDGHIETIYTATSPSWISTTQLDGTSIVVTGRSTVWIVDAQGVARLAPQRFRSIRFSTSERVGPNNVVRCLVPHPNQSLLVGTSDGTVEHIDASGNRRQLTQVPPSVNVMLPVFDRTYAVLGTYPWLVLLNTSTLQSSRTPLPGNVYHAIHTSDSTIVAGTNAIGSISSMLIRLTFSADKLRRIDTLAHVPANIWALCSLGSDSVYIGTSRGLYTWDGTRLTGVDSVVGYQNIWLLQADSRYLWIGTWGGGILCLDRQRQRIVRRFSATDVSIRTTGEGIILREGQILVSSNNGIYVLSYDSSRVPVRYDHLDGLHGNDFWPHAACIDSSNVLWFGGTNGLSYCQQPQTWTYTTPRADIVSVRDQWREYPRSPQKSLFHTYDVTLNTESDNVSLECLLVVTDAEARGTLMFRIDGGVWSPVSSENIIQLTNIAFGTTTVDVGVQSCDEQRIVVQGTVFLYRPRPFWATWWFIASFVLVCGSAVSAGVVQVLRTRARTVETEKLHLELEIQALRLQMNPHFLFNTLNAVQAAILSERAEIATPLVANFSKLVRNTLEVSREHSISLTRELELVRTYVDLERLRFHDSFDVTWNVDENVDTDTVRIPPILLQPFVENAILHGLSAKGHKGHLNITVSRIECDVVECRISDDGIGRHASQQRPRHHRSMGTTTTLERVAKLNRIHGDVLDVVIIDNHDASGRPSGTTVVIRINKELT